MTIESLIALLIASVIIKALPGPGVFATAGYAISSGLSSALYCVLGIMLGDLVYIVAVLFGLTIIAREFHEVFFIIRLLGGGYLIYLGIQTFRSAGSPNPASPRARTSNARAFLNGLLLTLGNPKVILFYVGLMPTFIDIAALGSTDMVILCLALTIDLGCILAGYAFTADKARKFFTSAKAARYMNRGAGTVLIGSGAAVITTS